MHRKRLLWQLYPSYLLIILGSLLAAGWFASHAVARLLDDSAVRVLQARAEHVERLWSSTTSLEPSEALQQHCLLLQELTQTRVTLYNTAGELLYDSQPGSPRIVGPEVLAARAGTLGRDRRVEIPGQPETVSVAVPARRDGAGRGIVRTSISVAAMGHDQQTVQWQMALGAVMIAALAALVGLFVSQRIARPLEEMRVGAERFAQGELSHKLVVPATLEMARLAETLNDMAQQLSERMRSMVRQSNEQRAVLASMVEGVLAVDMQQRIISLNQAAASLLGYSQSQATGRTLQEVIRNADLRRFAAQALVSDEPIAGDIVMHADGDRVLEAHGAALRDAQGLSIGAVIVLNDVSNYRRLENIRRDFVANVSHELKTPITSIKGFVETLLDGAMHDPEDAQRFLKIIARQADRLHAIIDDLLRLSRIEQSEESSDIPLEVAPLRPVLENAVHDCQPRAAERAIVIELSCDEHLTARINAPLLEQAVLNLLDNAIKYSGDEGRIVVSAVAQGGHAVVAVRDQGCGIPAEHLPRIFERFYRVDKARSRKLGGTGLGLAIVKHIVNVHQGRVTVESALGRGSTFSIFLPLEVGRPVPIVSLG